MQSRITSIARTLKSSERSTTQPSLLSIYTFLSPRSFSSSPSIETSKSQYPKTLEGLRHRLAAESLTLTDFIRFQSNKEYSVEVGTKKKPLPKPKWMKESIPGGEKYTQHMTT